jgi:hypothetical protein
MTRLLNKAVKEENIRIKERRKKTVEELETINKQKHWFVFFWNYNYILIEKRK